LLALYFVASFEPRAVTIAITGWFRKCTQKVYKSYTKTHEIWWADPTHDSKQACKVLWSWDHRWRSNC